MKQLLLALAVTVVLSVMAACETRPESTDLAPAAQLRAADQREAAVPENPGTP